MTKAEHLIHLALEKNIRIATAESLTGGLLAAALVSVSGASKVFVGGVVAYHTSLKSKLLGVDEQFLIEHGPVNKETAEQMAKGVTSLCDPAQQSGGKAIIGLATTGVAGPDADPQTGQLPGEVWIAVSFADEVISRRLDLTGGREVIRNSAVEQSIRITIAKLESM